MLKYLLLFYALFISVFSFSVVSKISNIEHSINDNNMNASHNANSINTISKNVQFINNLLFLEDEKVYKVLHLKTTVRKTIKSENAGRILSPKELATYTSAVLHYSEQYGVPVSLVLAVTRKESAFNPEAISKANARGIMQIIPRTAKECADNIGLKKYNLFSIRDNVQLGTWYLGSLLKTFKGNLELTIKAYNVGAMYVKNNLDNVVGFQEFPEETNAYYEDVIRYKLEYDNL